MKTRYLTGIARQTTLITICLLLVACVEKQYTPQELEAQSRGNTYCWLFDKALGIELPSGWKQVKGFKTDYFKRISGDANYFFVREDGEDLKLPVIVVRLTKLKSILSKETIRDQVAVKNNVDSVLFSRGISKYNLSKLEYDTDRNIFLWNANYALHSKHYMYNGLSPSEQAKMQYAGIPRYKDVTNETYLCNAHIFYDKYEIVFSLIDGILYFTDQPQKHNHTYENDFSRIIKSATFY
ncbi:MAG: hypothetical protein ABIK45_10535 [Pseudomonadota bacterium]